MQELSEYRQAVIRPLFTLIAAIGFVLSVFGTAHASDSTYKLGAGDQIKITVFGENDLTGQYEIDGAGIVAFPLIGQVQAADGTARDLEKSLTKKLKEGYLTNPVVNVEILTYRPFFILGEVARPGSYAYKSGLNVLNAVAMAGGYTYRAKSNLWVITRNGDAKYNGREVTNGDFRIQPGDTILIPERFF